MSVSMIVVLSVCVAAVSPGTQTTNAQESRPRTALEIRQSVDHQLAAETAAATSAQRIAVLRDMVALSGEIAAHPTLGKHTAATLRNRLAARLKRAERELAANAKRDSAKEVATVTPRANAGIVAQRFGGGAPLVADENVDGGEALADLIQDTVAPPSWQRNGGLGVIALFGQRRGGDLLAQVPPQGNNAGRRAGPAPLALTADASQELVDLIHEVVAPHTWDVNGGKGAVIFFAPNHALVVRQTDDVHEALFDVVGRLRRNP